ncbi:MAG: hypothetical protein WBA89_22980 [Microcoleus sp.]|uniref:hypothetical protein n=1 Tax=Microcoleus sp. TaxID=44472 RepID=UPI003C70A2C2
MTAYIPITTKRVIELLENLNGYAYNLISWNKLARPVCASLEVAAVSGSGKSASE